MGALAALSQIASSSPLLLTPLLKAGRIKDARSMAKITLNGTDFGYSGHFSVTAEHVKSYTNNIWTWYQPCRNGCDASTAPLLIWLQGGPGGPGWFGSLGEIGNWYIGGAAEDDKPHDRCFSWCLTNNCLFVDQPVNTGFSYQTVTATGVPVTDVNAVDYTDTSTGAMTQIYDLLLQFYQIFPELQPAPLVITGESYGGLYTPHLAAILK